MDYPLGALLRTLSRALSTVMLIGMAGCSITHAYRIEDGQRIDLAQMIVEVRNVPVVLVGEQHDMATHHEVQLEVIKGLHQVGKPLAIGLEMFTVDNQAALDDWIAGKIAEDRFADIYAENWRNMNWEFYRDIFLFARDNGIPMVALNAPRQIVEKVAHDGFSSLSAADLRALPVGSTVALSAENIQLMTAYYPEHGKDRRAFLHLCEAQALRNRVMAQGILRYRRQHPGTGMVVLAGAAHAWGKGGIPAELGPLPYKVILPPFPGIAIDAGSAAGAADYLLD
ncbi:MAG: ChaN family lipoprotein [Burkholderiales bacterium]